MIYSVFALMLSASALTACSDDGFSGDPAKDWNGSTTFFAPTDDQGFGTYYTPAVGRVGDPMPFYDQKAGDFKVLYLQEYINNMTFRFHPMAVPMKRMERTIFTIQATMVTVNIVRLSCVPHQMTSRLGQRTSFGR